MMYRLVFVLLLVAALCDGAPSPKQYLIETKNSGVDNKGGADYQVRIQDVVQGGA